MRKAAFFAYHKIRIHRGLWMKEQENLTGKGITAAVLDTGIFPHIDFDGRIAAFRDLVYGRETDRKSTMTMDTERMSVVSLAEVEERPAENTRVRHRDAGLS